LQTSIRVDLSTLYSRVTERRGVGRCPLQVSRGLYFDGGSNSSSSGSSGGYIVLDDSSHSAPPTFNLSTFRFSYWSYFSVTIVFRAATPDALLVTAWQSDSCFASLGLVDGQVRAHFDQPLYLYLDSTFSPLLSALGRPKRDARLSFRFSPTQLTRVCLASYRGHLS